MQFAHFWTQILKIFAYFLTLRNYLFKQNIAYNGIDLMLFSKPKFLLDTRIAYSG